MSKVLEELRQKTLSQVAPHLSHFNDCKPAFAISECKLWINKIFNDIAHITDLDSKVCDGCIRFDHESHLLNDEQYKLRFQICHKCIRQKTDLFQNKSCENCNHYIKTTNLCLKKIQNVNGFLDKDFCCNKYEPKATK